MDAISDEQRRGQADTPRGTADSADFVKRVGRTLPGRGHGAEYVTLAETTLAPPCEVNPEIIDVTSFARARRILILAGLLVTLTVAFYLLPKLLKIPLLLVFVLIGNWPDGSPISDSSAVVSSALGAFFWLIMAGIFFLWLVNRLKRGDATACGFYLIAVVSPCLFISVLFVVVVVWAPVYDYISNDHVIFTLNDISKSFIAFLVILLIFPFSISWIGFSIIHSIVGIGVARSFVFSSDRTALRHHVLSRGQRERRRRVYAKHLRHRLNSFSERRASIFRARILAYRTASGMFVTLGVLTVLFLQFVGFGLPAISNKQLGDNDLLGFHREQVDQVHVNQFFDFVGMFIRAIPISWVLLVLWLTPAAFFAVRAERLRAIQADVLRASDPRPPVLLLRSFADDNLPFRRRLMPERLFVGNTFFYRGFTFEQLVAEEVSDIGPLITVGEPNERLPPLGGARAYIQDLDWHEGVSHLIDEAGLVVLMVARTESFLWELRYVVEHGLLHKALLLFPPVEDQQGRGELGTRYEVAHAFLPPPIAEQLTTHLVEAARILLILFPAPDRIVLVCGDQRNQWFYESAFDMALDVLAGRPTLTLDPHDREAEKGLFAVSRG